jgi:hypothetical protein
VEHAHARHEFGCGTFNDSSCLAFDQRATNLPYTAR